jgi:hypothetical protein
MPENKVRLISNSEHLVLSTDSFQDILRKNGPGAFNKIHMSNLGDWITREQFLELLELFRKYCLPGTIICYCYLQKNHFAEVSGGPFQINDKMAETAGKKDRFPFYGLIPVIITD